MAVLVMLYRQFTDVQDEIISVLAQPLAMELTAALVRVEAEHPIKVLDPWAESLATLSMVEMRHLMTC
jgi:hypothetical protein